MDNYDAAILFNRVPIMPTKLLMAYMYKTEGLLPDQAERVIHSLAREEVIAFVDNKKYVARRRAATFTERDRINALVFAVVCHFLPDSAGFTMTPTGINAHFTYQPKNTKDGTEALPYLVQLIYVPNGHEDVVSAQLLTEPVFEDAPDVIRRIAIMENPENHEKMRFVGIRDFAYVDPETYKVKVFARRPKSEAWEDIFDV